MTALAKAMEGKSLTEGATKSALGEAVDKITNLKKKAEGAKETMDTAGRQVLCTVATQGTLFTSSFAAGALGDKYIKPGGMVDVRPVGAAVATGYALYDLMTGGKYGDIALAVANGIGGSWLAEVGKSAGEGAKKMWAEKAAEGGAGPKEGDVRVAADGVNAGKNEVFKGGQWVLAGAIGTRDVRLTPEGRRRGLPARRRRADDYYDEE